MAETKVLQIIHVTDLHVGVDGINSESRHLREGNRAALRIARHLQRNNTFGFVEGTQTHFHRGMAAFEAFIEDLKAAEPEWFEKPTWIVDTGDLTTFGDLESIAAGKAFLNRLRAAAGNCSTMQLYGNHDAWPATHPATLWHRYYEELVDQRGRLTSHTEWQPQRWLLPLRAPIPVVNTNAHIELYGLDTVGWEGLRNLRAVGSIDPRAITELQEKIDAQYERERPRNFRILACHHPVTFPYEAEEVRVGSPLIDQMRLTDAAKVAYRIGTGQRSRDRGPYVHMIVSGHAHMRYPGGKMQTGPFRQKGLEPTQLQFVGSSLMLNTSRGTGALPTPTLPEPSERSVDGFGRVTIDHHCAQADLVRFTVKSGRPARTDEPLILTIERTPALSYLGSEYVLMPSRSQMFRRGI